MTVTNNFSLVLPTVGGDTNIWGNLLNTGVMTALDSILGSSLPVSITSSNVTLTPAQFQNAVFALSGTLTGNRNLIIPLSTNSATVACAGRFVVDNQTAGAFNVTVITEAVGSTGVIVPQGLRTWLYSDGTNVTYCDDSKVYVVGVNGTPNGQLAGTTGTVRNPPYPFAFDYTNKKLYLPTTTGDATTTIWQQFVLGNSPSPVALVANLVIKTTTNTALTVAASGVTVTDGSGNYLTVAPGSTINMATTGVNALDTGAIAAAKWYAIWVIAKTDGTTACLASLSFTRGGLTLPAGYTLSGRVGAVRTAPAVAQLMGTWQFGNVAQYIVGLLNTTALPRIAVGSAAGPATGDPLVGTYVAASVSNFVPTTASVINILGVANGNSMVLAAAPDTSYGGLNSLVNPPPIAIFNASSGLGTAGTGVSIAQTARFVLESTNIYWAIDNQASATNNYGGVNCVGWEDNL